LFDPEDLKRIEKARALLKEGKLEVPKRSGEVESFSVPNL
jgi:hypothetical protein